MKAETYGRLLKALQKLEKRIVAAYVEAVRADGDLRARVEARHRAAEVGGRPDDFAKLCARRSAVQLLLRTVYVRVLEDLGALEPARIRGERGLDAFRAVAPALGVRSYLAWTFRDLAHDFPALFTPGDDELPLPGADLCRELWDLWHAEDGRGNLRYDWRNGEGGGEAFDSRFLGDLYQDLDAEVRKRYALLQTPEFVERYILDKTLTPALEEFDPETLAGRGETFRLIDPTCGSGHFLLGAFHRLADWWEALGLDRWDAAVRALGSVWGCDINPHAVDIAAFRLLLEVRERTGVGNLDRLAALPLHLRALDSLIPWERRTGQVELFPGADRLSVYATEEERAGNAAFLGHDFHVVVGNPPYITPKDVRKRDDYRAFWPDSASRKYALSAPFAERVFDLGCDDAFTGQITANSFMKREFGRKLVETVFPHWDLTSVVDTSGVPVTGHKVPTVLLFGRSRPPVDGSVWAVLGKRWEPEQPDSAEEGVVWSAIRAAGAGPDDSSPYITVAWVARELLGTHPWSLGGGHAPELTRGIERSASALLADHASLVGLGGFTGSDEVFVLGRPAGALRLEAAVCRPLVTGESVRDWALSSDGVALAPYDAGGGLLDAHRLGNGVQWVWKARSHVLAVKSFGGRTRGQLREPWWSWYRWQPERLHPPALTFADVATHNHFVLVRGGKVFNRTAPIIKLPTDAALDDYLGILGLLNSSTFGFWMRQMFHAKGGAQVGKKIQSEEWSRYFAFDATKLQRAPITDHDRARRIALTRVLDAAATERRCCLPSAVLAKDWAAADLGDLLADARRRYRELTHRMVALQEELDWLTYGSYGLIDPVETVGPDEVEPLAPGHRPFEILWARRVDRGEEREYWFAAHGHDRVTEVPGHYSPAHRARLHARVAAIAADERLQLLESPAHKRRWQTPDLDSEARKAAEFWLFDRLEDLFIEGGPLSEPRPYTLERIVAALGRDPRVAAAARILTGETDVDLTLVAERLLRDQALPDNPHRVYTVDGIRKLDAWKEVWRLQDLEDAGEDPGEIPLPPKLTRKDFKPPNAYALRGKLNVPRERFILFADLSPHRYGWNGWRDLPRALAQVEAFSLVETDAHAPLPVPSADDPRRCGPTLGLWESLPDVRRWQPEDHAELAALAEEACQQKTCPCALLERWQAWLAGDLELGATAEAAADEVTLEERANVAQQLVLFGTDGARLAELEQRWAAPPARLLAVLDDLVASGDVAVKGRGKQRRWANVR